MPLTDEQKHQNRLQRFCKHMEPLDWNNRYDYVLKEFQKLRRMEEADDQGYVICISSGQRMKWNDGCDGGHYIRSVNRAVCFHPDNVWPQRKYDNHQLSGNRVAYRPALIAKIGQERFDALELESSDQNFRHTVEQLAELKAEFRDRIKVQEKRLAGT